MKCENKVMGVWKQARNTITGRTQQQNEQPEQDSVPRTPPPAYSPWPTDATAPPQERLPVPVHVRYNQPSPTHQNRDDPVKDICTRLFILLIAVMFIIAMFAGVVTYTFLSLFSASSTAYAGAKGCFALLVLSFIFLFYLMRKL